MQNLEQEVVAFAQQVLNAVQLGSIYALIALGYSLVYGVLSMINFSHGSIFMLGAFACLLIASAISLPIAVIIVLVMIIMSVVGVLIELAAYRPLRNAPRVSAIITALGCGLVIQYTVLSICPTSKPMPDLFKSVTYNMWGVTISTLQILIIVTAVVLMFGLDYLIRKTPLGFAMRAVSFDRNVVPLMGVPVNRIISLTFGIGAALGGAAGMLYGLAYPSIEAAMGSSIGWKAFIAAVVGGIGSIRGAVLGGFILGAVEIAASANQYTSSSLRDLICYSLLLVILIFKPYGILGKAPNQKV